MPRSVIVPVLALALGLASGCATVDVKADFDPAVDFNRYHTFQLLGGKLIVNGQPDDANTLVKDRIAEAIVTELGSRGLQSVSSNAGLVVTYVAGARKITEIETTGPYDGWGPFWGPVDWWGPVYSDWWVRHYTKGTLVIDLVDAQTRKLVWRAYAEADVNSPDARDVIRKGVHKAFENYPPRR